MSHPHRRSGHHGGDHRQRFHLDPGDEETEIADIGLEKGARFAIREGGKTAGAGIVTKIIQ